MVQGVIHQQFSDIGPIYVHGNSMLMQLFCATSTLIIVGGIFLITAFNL